MTHDLLLFLATFLASGVEAVEALTIVLAVGVVRGWRSPLIGVGAAALVLAVIVAVLGPALRLLPIDTLRLVVGALLFVFGLQWLRKAILRSSGYKALHDEEAAFAAEREEATLAGRGRAAAGLDWYGSRSPSRACCSKGSRSCSSSLTFGAAAGPAPLRPPAPRRAVVLVVIGWGRRCDRPCRAGPGEHDQVRGRRTSLTTFGVFWTARARARTGPARRPRSWPSSPSLASCRSCSSASSVGSDSRHFPLVPAEVHPRVRRVLVGLHRRRRLARRSRRRRRPRNHRLPRPSRPRRLVGCSPPQSTRPQRVAATLDASEPVT